MDFSKSFGEAWRNMKASLFTKTPPRAWFFIGLYAWLANLGGGMGFTFNLPSGKDGGGIEKFFSELAAPFCGEGNAMNSTALTIVITVVAFIFIVGLVLSIVMLWVRCRGRFMFNDVILNGPETSLFLSRWSWFAKRSNSYFLAYLTYVAAEFVIALLFIAFSVFAIAAGGKENLVMSVIIVLLVAMAAGVIIGIPLAVFNTAFEDFGVIAMMKDPALTGFGAMKKIFLLILKKPGDILLYAMCIFGINIVTGLAMAVFAIVFALCLCLGPVILMLPYAWAVVFLPFLLFKAKFTLECARSLGDAYALEPTPPEALRY